MSRETFIESEGFKTDRHGIGRKLFALRGDRTRETVARAIGISTSALQMYENGQRVPRDEVKMRLARYYETTIELLFFTSDVHET